MGGAYEDEVKTKPIKGTGVTEGEATGVRYHLVGGTVHFHDDKAKPATKVEVPLSDWLKRWEDLRSPAEMVQDGKNLILTACRSYSNPDRGTLLLCKSSIELGKAGLSKANRVATFSLQIIPITYDEPWMALEDFRNRGR